MTLILRVRLIMLVCSVTAKNGAVLLKERTIATLGAGEHRSHTAFASQKIITGMVPHEEPHGLQYIARFPFRSHFCHLYARIRKLRLEKYPVKCLKQAVCQLHLALCRAGGSF